VLLDGFSLGVGILFPFAADDEHRSVLMNSVAPVWDGNQTWLVFGGALLFGAFPAAFNQLLSALYLPLILMLVALVFRGTSFEFRAEATDKRPWNWAFALGSALAAFCQGWVLGTYVLGIGKPGSLASSYFFPLLAGLAVPCAYTLLGCCWLIIKTDGAWNRAARHWSRRLLPVMAAFVALVSLWTPLAEQAIAQRWFSWPNLLFLSPVPVLTAALGVSLYRALMSRNDHAPFVLCVALYLLTLSGLAISLWPYIVPRTVTLWQAASPPETQIFLLAGVAVILPVVLIYTAHAYYVFRGKVSAGHGY
jgi:cytochrome d ubiquinol oxidase subunit II